MNFWRSACALAVLCSTAPAAVVVDCEYREVARYIRFVVTEDDAGFQTRYYDSNGVPLVETLGIGGRGQFTDLTIHFPKIGPIGSLCTLVGTPVTDMWCHDSMLNATVTKPNGEVIPVSLETPSLELAVQGGTVPTRVAYRIFGVRGVIMGAQNGSFLGPACHR